MHPALEQLKAKADAATSGPWFNNAYRSSISQQDPSKSPEKGKRLVVLIQEGCHEDRQFITAANPDAVRKLIEVIERLQSVLESEGVESETANEILNTLVQQ